LKITRLWLLILVGTFLGTPLYAQEDAPDSPPEDIFIPTYSLGDQTLTITMGMMIPLFFSGAGVQNTNLTLGGGGSLQWNSYLNNNMTLGGELGGTFLFTPNQRTLFMVPLTVRYAYIMRSYPFEFPIYIGAGVNMSRLEGDTKFDPIIKPGASFFWNYNAQWAFGVNAVYWMVFQYYRGDEPPREDSRIGNFLETTLSAIYRF
jgi:hypothetical protein